MFKQTKKENKKKGKFDHWYLLTDTDGNKSISFTMVFASFGAVTLWLLLSICEEIIGIKIREFSGTEAMAYLVPVFGIYFGRKTQTSNSGSNNSSNDLTSEDVNNNQQ